MSKINLRLIATMTAAGLFLAASGCDVPPEEYETSEPAALVSQNAAQPETRRQIGVVSWSIKKTSKDFWVSGLGANGADVFRARLKPHFNGEGMILSVKKPAKQIVAIRGHEVLNCNDVRNCVPFSPGQLDKRVQAAIKRFVSDMSSARVPYADNSCHWDTVLCALDVAGCVSDPGVVSCAGAAVSCYEAADSCGVIDTWKDQCERNIIYCGNTEFPY